MSNSHIARCVAAALAVGSTACAPSGVHASHDGGTEGHSGSASSGSTGGGSGASHGSGAASSGHASSGDPYGAPDGATNAGPPSLGALTAKATGRAGGNLVITVQGTDPNANAYGVDLTLEDSAGQPVVAFDGAWDGQPSTGERSVLFDQSSAVGQKSFTRTVTLPAFMTQFPAIVTVAAAIEDESGLTSNSMTATVSLQTERMSGQSCDPTLVANRCAVGLACAGTSPVCTQGPAPVLTNFGYIPSALGPQMLFVGTDPADDIASMHVEFLDASGKPVMVDLTGNNDLASSVDLDVSGSSTFGSYFYLNQAAQGFETQVPHLAATPSDSLGVIGARVLTSFTAPQAAADGAACDPRGFAQCGSTDTCAPAPVPDGGAPSGRSVCVKTSGEEDALSKAAPVLDLAKGATYATGYAHAPNVWNPPADCVASGVLDFPQGVVSLHVDAQLPTLTITTANPETNFDTVLYLLPGLGSTAGASIACNDDTTGYTSTLVLKNLAAGDYTIVVGSATPTGGNFAVSIK